MTPRRSLRVSNSEFQELQALLTNRTKRYRTGRILVQGVRPLTIAEERGWKFLQLLTVEQRALSSWARSFLDAHRSVEVLELSAPLFAELSEREDGAELLGVVELQRPDLSKLLSGSGPILILDRPSYPGNIGTTIRAADAFQGSGVIVLGHAADPFDPKSVRASTGSIFSVPVVHEPRSIAEVSVECKDSGWSLCALDEGGDGSLYEVEIPSRVAFVIGAEGVGLSRAARECADLTAAIPIAGSASSLNMAIAASIALYEYRRRFAL